MTADVLVPEATHQERTILGVLMLGTNDVAFGECERLQEHMFFLDSHRAIYGAIQAVFATGQSVHVGSVQAELERRKQFTRVGGIQYLWPLTEDLPHGMNVQFYASQVRDRWLRREAQRVAKALTDNAADLSEPIAETLSTASDQVMATLNEQKREDTAFSVFGASVVQDLLRRSEMPEEERRGLTYGHPGLDDVTFGAFPSETTVIGARSGVGKSALMMQAVHANVMRGVPCVIFSLEMTKAKCTNRLLALESGVPFWKIREAKLTRDDRARILAAHDRINDGGALTIHDRGSMSLSEMTALARVAIRRDGAKLIALDYLQIAEAPGRERTERVTRTSRAFTNLCKEEGVHGLLLSQLRKPTTSAGFEARPEVSDLRETGTIENDASVIVLLHRRYLKASGKWDTDSKIYVPKVRDAEQSSFLSRFDRNTVSYLHDPTVQDWDLHQS